MFKKIMRKILPEFLVRFFRAICNQYLDGFSIKSYSQEGEDMILRRLFERVPKGFYVDVGAHHPMRFSNTYYFYKQGWRGINIDAMPGSMKIFNKRRPKDINIEKPIADKPGMLTYYAFNEPALNGFSERLSLERNNTKDYHIKFTKDLETTTLENIFNNYLAEGKKIDFLSIDVEGLDFQVLKSNDFYKYKPSVILIELLGSSLHELEEDEVSIYLKKYNYSIYAKAVHTVFFVQDDFFERRNKT